ncbi:hypothetical protein [Bradyrhizobium japonicum]|uniref:hypothetical protein n=1 Tax=Bradyrhizobium japonicum TaxID=375 RepID=UPI00200C0B22|nr:hypothetical protein [Bradyrhizobium japonicum]
MSMIETTGTILDWDVTTVKRAGLSRDLPSGNPDLMWVANSSTLIYGERDAVLVKLYEAMLALHPDRANPGSLWSGANAARGPRS